MKSVDLKKNSKEYKSLYDKQRREDFVNTHGSSVGTYYRNRTFKSFMAMLLRNAKRRCVERDYKIDIDLQFLVDLLEKQEYKCALTGLELTHIAGKGEIIPTNVSIDRIDSSIGYLKTNVQLVCTQANFMKNKLNLEELYDYCEKILETRNVKYGRKNSSRSNS